MQASIISILSEANSLHSLAVNVVQAFELSIIGIVIGAFVFGDKAKQRQVKTFRDKMRLAWRPALTTGCLLFFVAFWFITVLRSAADQAATLKPLKPELRAEVGQFFMNDDRNDPKNKMVIFALYISNTGESSIAKNFSLEIQNPVKEKFHGITLPLSYVGAGITLSNKDNPALAQFPRQAYLPFALSEQPVPPGAGKNGWVGFLVPNATTQAISGPGTVFELKFEDVTGHPQTIKYPIPSIGDQK